mgnify:CR=1 FL=1
MKKTILVALAITLGAGANVALAEGGPGLNRPFGDPNGPYSYGARQAAPSLAAVLQAESTTQSALRSSLAAISRLFGSFNESFL